MKGPHKFVQTEDEKIQQIDQREEKINAIVKDIKKRHKTISISDSLKSMQEMKKLQA
jgi:hypothetical protein